MALGAQLLREWKRSLECYHLCMVSKAWCLSRAAGSKVVEFLCDRKALLVGRRDGTIIYMTRRLDAILGSVTMHNGGGVWRIATHKCADYVAVAMGNGELRLLDFRRGAPIEAASFMPLHGRRVVSMAFLPDGDNFGSVYAVGAGVSPIHECSNKALWSTTAKGNKSVAFYSEFCSNDAYRRGIAGSRHAETMLALEDEVWRKRKLSSQCTSLCLRFSMVVRRRRRLAGLYSLLRRRKTRRRILCEVMSGRSHF